ncbi:MAG: hypothetical protein U0840_16195 [Gemmataceae bacterium]
MSSSSMHHAWSVAVVGCALVVSSVDAQTRSTTRRPRGDVHQMQILDGSRQTVRYFGQNLSPSESSTLREMERLENESAYVNDLQALKRQFVISERQLELHRRQVQMQLYGVETTRNSYGTIFAGYPSNNLTGYYGYPGNYTAFGGYGAGYGNGFGGGAVGGDSVTQTSGLSQGVGPESRITEAMAGVLAQQATPEYAAKIDRSLDLAALRASASPSLRVALGLPTPERSREERNAVRLASDDSSSSAGLVTLTLKGGDVLQGTKLTEKGDWIILDRADGSQERIRQTEVVRMQLPRARGGIVPAVND